MKKIILPVVIVALSLFTFAQKPATSLLNPTNHTLVFIDLESQMGFATENIEMSELRNNIGIVAGTSKIFKVPVVLTTAAIKTFAGPVFPELSEFYPVATSNYMDRSNMNTWEDVTVHKEIVAKGNKRVVFAGLWTSVCIVDAVLSAIDEGYDVYMITDACGDVSKEAHDMAIQRMVIAGAKPMTSMQYLLELQRDWARTATYKPVTDLIKKYGGTYGLGVQYAHDMLKH